MSEFVEKSENDLKEVQDEIDENHYISDEELNAFYESGQYQAYTFGGRNGFHIAASLGMIDVVAKLLKQCENEKDLTALQLYREGDLEKKIIRKITGINQQDLSGDTALIMAVWSNDKDMVEYLCSKKADIYIKGSDGNTALDLAREYKKTEILKILEKYANQS